MNLRIGSASAAWGDTIHGARQLVESGQVDFLVGDYLAEVTMAILARMRAKSETCGYIPDWLDSVAPVLGQIKAQGIRLVTNSGGMNPLGCRDAFEALAAEAGLTFKVAVVTGDDLSARFEQMRADADPALFQDMFTGAAAPERFASLNAYLGAAGIARALDQGADVVITGRCVDSAMVLGPLIHHFGWAADDWDRLAQGALAGHVIECGVQGSGGLATDWQDMAEGWDDMGFPIAEVAADGSFHIEKPAGTGGRISALTIAEQILYEIGDPASYLLPDVTCDFREVRLSETAPDIVQVTGAKGRPPSGALKICGTWADGFRLITTYLLTGGDAGARGQAMAEALIRRCNRLLDQRGMAPFTDTSIEVIGTGAHYPEALRHPAREVVIKLGLRHPDAKALALFAREFAMPGVSMAQGLSGAFAGRPKPAPVLRVHSMLWPATDVPVSVHFEGHSETLPSAPLWPPQEAAALPALTQSQAQEADLTVPLRQLAVARSGDKGDDANIGIIAREARFLPRILAEVTPEAVADWFAHFLTGDVTRYELPGLNAVNFVLRGVLDGGGSASLRYDPQAKGYGQVLLDMPVRVPREWLAQGGALG